MDNFIFQVWQTNLTFAAALVRLAVLLYCLRLTALYRKPIWFA
ncbi:hypothetical protein EIKCOROL_00873 [Eikenella corrodens ATCC 23834]|uniref:Uncharacterized protein n=1 Tax=Eikenella corrodens ATCC 23834 TaxID=546274 RepID=C0DU42_EIKCO|nr:hypothetical protein EIKCOROL_00873 [Eikenella corrodens ATCC 23834]